MFGEGPIDAGGGRVLSLAPACGDDQVRPDLLDGLVPPSSGGPRSMSSVMTGSRPPCLPLRPRCRALPAPTAGCSPARSPPWPRSRRTSERSRVRRHRFFSGFRLHLLSTVEDIPVTWCPCGVSNPVAQSHSILAHDGISVRCAGQGPAPSRSCRGSATFRETEPCAITVRQIENGWSEARPVPRVARSYSPASQTQGA